MDIVTFISQHATPYGLLIALLWGLWRLAVRVIDDVGRPVAARGVQYLDHRQQLDQKMAERLDAIATVQKEHLDICRGGHPLGVAPDHHR